MSSSSSPIRPPHRPDPSRTRPPGRPSRRELLDRIEWLEAHVERLVSAELEEARRPRPEPVPPVRPSRLLDPVRFLRSLLP